MYADYSYYANTFKGSTLDVDTSVKALEKASTHIDTLTYNRIKGVGFEKLTPFQVEIIKNTCCQMADWETENADILNTSMKSYAINGVSMEFSGITQNGVMVDGEILSYLQQSGLCCCSLRGW